MTLTYFYEIHVAKKTISMYLSEMNFHSSEDNILGSENNILGCFGI